jgi:hypothetical protein
LAFLPVELLPKLEPAGGVDWNKVGSARAALGSLAFVAERGDDERET